MIAPVALDRTPPPPPSQGTEPAAQAGIADWAPRPLAAAAAVMPVMAPAAANDVNLVGRAKENALLSADVYNATPAPPPGWRVADAADLERLNLTPAMLEAPGSSFRARVYETGTGDQTRYVVAFRGSSSGEDWLNNAQQGLGFDASSYQKALRIGRELAATDAEVVLTGHSLGSGLASAAAVASGRQADTFNAAGLHGDTIAAARGIATENGRGAAPVQAYHVPNEALTSVQNGTDIPDAYGTQRELPDGSPAGKNWFDRHNPIDRHMIDWVLAGAAALR